jgi:integrase
MDPMAGAYRAETTAPTCEQTLSQAWELFKAERSVSLCPTSLSSDYAQVSKWLARCPIQEFHDGRRVLTWLLQQKPDKAARRVCMYVRSLYRWASAEDVAILPRNPVANFRMPKAPQSDHEVVVIPREEIPLVLVALESKRTCNGVNWALFAEFMLQTALRTGEARAITWADIDGDRVLIHSNYTLTHGHKNSTKTNKKRWVPLNARAQEILASLSRNSDYVFPWNRFAFQSFFIKRMSQLHSAGLIKKRYRPYDLRHVAISRWLEAGIPVTQAASWAGNTSEVIWRHYAATTAEYEVPVI